MHICMFIFSCNTLLEEIIYVGYCCWFVVNIKENIHLTCNNVKHNVIHLPSLFIALIAFDFQVTTSVILQHCQILFFFLFSFVNHCFRGWSKINVKVYDVIHCLNKNLITHFVWYLEQVWHWHIANFFEPNPSEKARL